MDYGVLSSQALIQACLDTRDVRAWQEFVCRYQKLIAAVVIRTCARWGEASPQIVDELIQETYLKLCEDGCRILRTFQPERDDAFFGYIKVLTANLVHDHFKASRSQKRGGAAVTASSDSQEMTFSEPKQSYVSEALDRTLLFNSIDACLRVITTGPTSQRDRRIFWLYYKVGLSAATIAMLPTISLTTKGVESTLLRLTKQVRERLVPAKGQGLGRIREGIHPAESF